MTTALELYDFIEKSKPEHLTIKDVKQLKVGNTIDVVMWDRNFEEYWIWNNGKYGILYDPETFFVANHNKITYLGNMEWNIHFRSGDVTCPIHLDVSNLETYWRWVEINEKDGMIHITNEILNKGEKIPDAWKPKHIHWTDFPETTRVGWRGSIMLWEKLKTMPKVYFVKDFYGNKK
jgi:hypothetical protein